MNFLSDINISFLFFSCFSPWSKAYILQVIVLNKSMLIDTGPVFSFSFLFVDCSIWYTLVVLYDFHGFLLHTEWVFLHIDHNGLAISSNIT